MVLWRKPPKHYLGYTEEGKFPIIILPGLTMKWGFMRSLGSAISHSGYPVYIIPQIGYNLLSIPKAAAIVREVVDTNHLDNVIIVAHSKGGLVGKYLLIHNNADRRIKAVVAIASPFSGSSLGRIVPHAAFKELAPDSDVVKSLSENTEVNTKIISIIPDFDNHVRSENGSYLNGAKNIYLAVRGHHKILFSKDLQSKVLFLIERITKKVAVQ